VITIDEIDGLTAGDLVHRRLTSLPATTTVGELREYFAASTSRHVALLTDGERFVGSIEALAVPADVDAAIGAAAYVTREPTIHPAAPATSARDIAMDEPSLRLPVVDDAGALIGIVAITARRDGFCGT
jgi:CBS domain-containing protein